MSAERATAWRVIGASVQGESHRRKGNPCQDSHCFGEVNGVLVAAVADGAGSAACSEIGSALAARAAVDDVTQRIAWEVPEGPDDWRRFMKNVFHVVRREIIKEAEQLEFKTLDLATTLLVTIVTPGWQAVGQVGDGAVVIRQANGVFQALTRPDAQEYVNETTFLTSEAFVDNVQYVVHKGQATGVSMFTDGLQRLALKMPHWEPHTAFFDPLLRLLAAAPARDQAEEQLRGFLLSPRITQRADDDLTLLLAVPER